MTNQEIIDRLATLTPGAVLSHDEFRGDLTLTIGRDGIVRVAETVKGELGFEMLIDAIGIDLYRPGERFEVVYQCYSLSHKRYLRLKVRAAEEDPVVPTLTPVWASANWYEREAWDMLGIRFAGHPDLRRMYMPEEFEHHPLRKDFPVMGIPDSLPLPRR
jgi:NADH-quinone oxidoreductase subunit C